MISSAQHGADVVESDEITLARHQTRVILGRLGWVLIGLFALDLIEASFVWARHQSDSLDVLPLIAGIILIRGGLRPVRTIRFIAGMTMVAGLIMTVYTMWAPWQLVDTELRLHDYSRELTFVIGCLYALVALAVYRGACSEPVELALQAEFGAPRWWNNPVIGPLTGLSLSLFLIALGVLAKPTFDIALDAARAKYGPSYRYVVAAWQSQNDVWNVEVEAYNSDSIRKVDVEIVSGQVKKVASLP